MDFRKTRPDGVPADAPDHDVAARPPLREELRHAMVALAAFILRPTLAVARVPFGLASLAFLLIVLLLDLALGFGILGLQFGAESLGIEQPVYEDPEWSLGEELALTIIAAPLIEEPLFRGWLTGRRATLIFAAAALLLALPLLLIAEPQAGDDDVAGTIAIVGIIAAGLWWGIMRNAPGMQRVPDWFRRHFHWIVWASALAFGLIHASNYSNFTLGFDLIYVLPQALGGLLYAFVRLRHGLRAVIIMHGSFNAIALGLDALIG